MVYCAAISAIVMRSLTNRTAEQNFELRNADFESNRTEIYSKTGLLAYATVIAGQVNL